MSPTQDAAFNICHIPAQQDIHHLCQKAQQLVFRLVLESFPNIIAVSIIEAKECFLSPLDGLFLFEWPRK
jgi:hypothetical protein